MRYRFIYPVIILFAALAFSGCNATDVTVAQKSTSAPTVGQTAHADGARRITFGEYDQLVREGKAFVVDVRNQASYDAGHIPGSVLIPSGEIANRLNELPRDKTIVTYCSCVEEHTAAIAVNTLKAQGVENAAALLGGFTEWQKEGRPVATQK